MGDMQTSELVHRVVPSPNWGERQRPITMVVIHYTEMKPIEAALERLTTPEGGVSAHYLISEAGEGRVQGARPYARRLGQVVAMAPGVGMRGELGEQDAGLSGGIGGSGHGDNSPYIELFVKARQIGRCLQDWRASVSRARPQTGRPRPIAFHEEKVRG